MTGRSRARGGLAVLTAVLTAVLAATTVLAGCGVTPEDAARPLSSESVPLSRLNRPTGAAQPPGARSESLQFVRGTSLVSVLRPALRLTPETVLSDLLSGPTPDERAQGLTTALPTGTDLRLAGVQDRVADVVLGGDLLDSGRSDQLLALAQVVVTLDDLPEVDAVRFLRDGVPVPVPRADGAIEPTPVTAADYAGLREGA